MTHDPWSARLRAGPIGWMAAHPVAANLLLLVLFVGGFLSIAQTKQEVFPDYDYDSIAISVAYPGASPVEVEQGAIVAIEEAVRGLEGVKRVDASASEGSGFVIAELFEGSDPNVVLADVKNAIDRVDTLPEHLEEPQVKIAGSRARVASLVIAGSRDLRTLHELADRARERLLASGAITQVEIPDIPPLEIAIEVSQTNLQKYGLTLADIAREVSEASVELPAGTVDTARGEVLIRVAERRTTGSDLADIVVKSNSRGGKVLLGDIATITDGYEDAYLRSYYNGKPALRLLVYRVGEETPTAIAEAIREAADELKREFPGDIDIVIWRDQSVMLQARIDVLVRNAMAGLVLVIAILALFLNLRLAFWVALGIPSAFFGAFLPLGTTSFSVNMVTLFAFIVTLGLVVDDAIVVGEHIFSKLREGKGRLQAAIEGAREMAIPVTFAVLTTIAAFAPLMFLPGFIGKVFAPIPLVVIAVLLASLVEAFFILPGHLAHERDTGRNHGPFGLIVRAIAPLGNGLRRTQDLVDRGLTYATRRYYCKLVIRTVRWRYISLAIGVAAVLLTLGYVLSGRVPFNFFPPSEGSGVTVEARLAYGAPIERTRELRRALEDSARRALEHHGGREYCRGIMTMVGGLFGEDGTIREKGSHLVTIETQLVPAEDRPFALPAFAQTWGEEMPPIPGLESISLNTGFGPGAGPSVAVTLRHADTEALARASAELTDTFRSYPNLKNIVNEYAAGKPQLDLELKPQARALDLTSSELATQLRGWLHGVEAVREQRGRDELKIVARLPRDERDDESDLTRLRVHTPRRGDVPLHYIANIERHRAPTTIFRENGARKVAVSAELNADAASPREVVDDLVARVFPRLRARYPQLVIDFAGAQRQQSETFASMTTNYGVAFLAIFALLAVVFRSYGQPFIILATVPFGCVGAVLGHVVMGEGLSVVSLMGAVALSGVVVNDSIVLLQAINEAAAAGATVSAAVVRAGSRRMRPILLTSATTFLGLAPLMFDDSVYNKLLVPMAISLGFGIVFATAVILLLVPALYAIGRDLRRANSTYVQAPVVSANDPASVELPAAE